MQGQCLCKAVTITVADSRELHACHCGMCRSWSGGGAAFALSAENPDIRGAEHIRHYQSSEWAERAFCGQCGTHLNLRPSERLDCSQILDKYYNQAAERD